MSENLLTKTLKAAKAVSHRLGQKLTPPELREPHLKLLLRNAVTAVDRIEKIADPAERLEEALQAKLALKCYRKNLESPGGALYRRKHSGSVAGHIEDIGALSVRLGDVARTAVLEDPVSIAASPKFPAIYESNRDIRPLFLAAFNCAVQGKTAGRESASLAVRRAAPPLLW